MSAMSRYIFVTGGVCSSLGKGIAAASIASLLELHGLKIQMVKIDPYINVDAGTMNPYQHGEVYVTDDGAETDLDLGNYARFTNARLTASNSITTGQIYQSVIRKEREGKFLGRCVQVIPHVTDEIKQRIIAIGEQKGVDVTIVEIGGTVGDIESIPFLEAARQFIHDIGRRNVLFIHLTLVPMVGEGEYKTKPTQHSAKTLLEIGIQPDILLCRSSEPLSEAMKSKIALFTNVEDESVISAYDVKTTIYEIPLSFSLQNLDRIILQKLGIDFTKADLSIWEKPYKIYQDAGSTVRVGIVGKYLHVHDSYKSIFEALVHGGFANQSRIELAKVDSEELEREEDIAGFFSAVDGIIIPGGFGSRGIDGMVKAVRYARENALPYLGICLGLQVMIIEYARNVLHLSDANSTEFGPDTKHPVVSLLEEQLEVTTMGGTMRLGKEESRLVKFPTAIANPWRKPGS
jgi:CTP synthase